MKKKSITNLNLNKKVISDLDSLHKVQGGDNWTDIFRTFFISCPAEPEPEPLPETFMPVCPSDRGNACPSL